MSGFLTSALRLIRPRQWVKNGFVVIPIVFGLRFMDFGAWAQSLLAFAVFCCVASAIYVFNDLRDRDADRVHPKKCTRPLASGALSPAQGWGILAFLLAAALALLVAGDFSSGFLIVLGVYALNSFAYSLGLKQVSLVEMFIVASGYVLRVVAGCLALGVESSAWLLAAAGVISLLIVAGKRRAEMAENLDEDQNRKSLKGYNIVFLDSLISLLGGVTIVVYLLFTTSEYAMTRYGSPYLVITSLFVAFGVLRYIQLIKVGSGADAPTDLVLKDKGIAGAVLLWLLSLGAIILYG